MTWLKVLRRHLPGLEVAALFLAVATLSAAAGGQAAQAKPNQQASSSQYVGADTCKTCHEDLFNSFQKTRHWDSVLKSKEGAVAHSCETCHGPGAEHVNAGGDVAKIVSFKNLSASEASTRCLSCHEPKTQTAKFSSGVHADANVSCVSCHSVHNAKPITRLLSDKVPQLCFSCHTEVRAEFDRPYRHRVTQGLVDCKDCHNEHGSFVAKELRTTGNQDAICFKCHTEKQGPFTFEHLPVKTEGCASCHTPHGSTNPRLLTVSQVNLLCLQCHTLTADVEGPPPAGPTHNQNQRFQACTLCHTAIHGSNFSSVFFK